MKLTTFTDYSLRVLIYLATQPGRRATIAQIAGAFDVSENHLVKVVHFLGKNGWLANVRGKGGGLELAHAPARINIGCVVRQTEGAAVVAECFSDAGSHCVIARSCRLQGRAGRSGHGFLRRAGPLHPGRPRAQPRGTGHHPVHGASARRHAHRGGRVSQPAFAYEGPQELLAPIDAGLAPRGRSGGGDEHRRCRPGVWRDRGSRAGARASDDDVGSLPRGRCHHRATSSSSSTAWCRPIC